MPNGYPTIINNVSIDIIYSHTNGTDYAGIIDDLEFNTTLFKLENVYAEFDSYQELFGGGFMLQIPGNLLPGKDSLTDNVSEVKKDLLLINEFENIQVEIVDEEGKLIEKTDFEGFLRMQKTFGLSLLKVGMEIEFISGAINKLIVTIGAKIPLGPTGLFITEMTGGVDDLTDPDNWKIIANVNIETGLEISPELGSPIKLDDFGAEVHPMSYFKGGGAFQIFNETVANGFIEYDGSLQSLSGTSTLNLLDMLVGNNAFSLQGGQFSGSSNATLKTPDDLPWWLNWAENIVIGSAEVDFNNYHIQSMAYLIGLSIAQKMEFGKETFPWFHYYLGPNYGFMAQIWKGYRKGKQAIDFQVQENIGQLLLVAGDSINNQLFDFTITDPLGNIYDSLNTNYQKFENTSQTIMIVNNPMDGEWSFSTDYTGDVVLDTKGLNQSPSALANEPGTKGTRSNQVSLNFIDYSDTLIVMVFYDTDQKNFDGRKINEFELINNATLEFEWQNEDIPNGEYFIYCRIDDGYNAPVLQYAPGSIIVENDTNIETPQNLSTIQESDSVKVQWDEATYANTIAATVFFKNISNGFVDQTSVSDINLAYLKDLNYGQEYEIWCSFINENGTISPKSNIVNLIFTSSLKNNPPYFTMDTDSIWIFVENETGEYTLSANDADGNNLTFDIPGDTLGVQINDITLSWTPDYNDRGVYNLLITVTDGSETDSLLQEIIVYTQEQLEVKVAFSSLNLYEDDNMFVKIKNFRSANSNETVA